LKNSVIVYHNHITCVFFLLFSLLLVHLSKFAVSVHFIFHVNKVVSLSVEYIWSTVHNNWQTQKIQSGEIFLKALKTPILT
jgi:hypothetical protein